MQQFLKAAVGSAGAQVVAAELFEQLFLARSGRTAWSAALTRNGGIATIGLSGNIDLSISSIAQHEVTGGQP